MGRLPGDVQALALGLLNHADDEGYFLADPAVVRSALRPFDDTATGVRKGLEELVRAGWVEVRTHPTHGNIGLVVNFPKHQRIDRKNESNLKQYYDLAPFDERSTNARRTLDESSLLEGKGREGNREGKGTGKVVALPHPLQSVCNDNRAPSMPEWKETTATRKKHADARLKERPLEEWATIVRRLVLSDFASGRTGKWAASPDWLVSGPGNAAKVLEGNYDNRGQPQQEALPQYTVT